MKKTLTVEGHEIAVERNGEADFISLTDIAKKFKHESEPFNLIANWLEAKSTLSFFEAWEGLYNPDFKPLQMQGIKADSVSNRFSNAPRLNGTSSGSPISSKRRETGSTRFLANGLCAIGSMGRHELRFHQKKIATVKKIFALALLALAAPGLFSQTIAPENAPFEQGKPLRFTFSGGTGSPTDWIGIYKKGQTPGQTSSTVWQYVAAPSGTVEFAGTLDTGRWDAHLFCCDGYQILASHKNFWIGPSHFRSRLSFYKTTDSLVFELKNVAAGDRLALFKSSDFVGGQPSAGAAAVAEKVFSTASAGETALFAPNFLAQKMVAVFQNQAGATVSFEPFEIKNAPVFPAVLTRIGLGSCSHQSAPQPTVEHLLARGIEAHVMMGDNVYIDTYSEKTLRDGYENMIRSRPEFQKLRATAPILATWDDHDYGCCDEDKDYPLKKQSQKIFLDFFEEPQNSPRRAQNGVHASYFFGPTGQRLQVIALDTRYFLDDKRPNNGCGKNDYCSWAAPGDEAKTMLGAEQWAWLKTELEKPADLRMIVSSVQFSSQYHGFESWANFPFEQRKMLQLIGSTGADRVFFVSGDMHYSEVSRLDGWPTPYPIYDFTASAINEAWPPETNSNRVGAKAYGEPNAGLLEIDWAGQKMVFSVIDAADQVRFSHEVAFSEIEKTGSATGQGSAAPPFSMRQTPAPDRGKARLVFSEKATGELRLVDSAGRLVLKKTAREAEFLDLDGLAAGIFVAEFLGEKGKTATAKIVVE